MHLRAFRSPGTAAAPRGRGGGRLGQGKLSSHSRKAAGSADRRDPLRTRSAQRARTGLGCRDAAPPAGARLPVRPVLPFRPRAGPRRRAPGNRPPRERRACPAAGPTVAPRCPDKLPSSWAPRPRWLASCGSPARLSRSPGYRRPRPARRASSLPLCNPEPRAPSGPRASAPTKQAARRRPGEGLGVAAGAPKPGQGAPRPGEYGVKGQRGRGGQKKGKKVSCSRRERLAFFALLALSAPPTRARPPVPVAVGRDRERGRGDAAAWRASRSLTSVQSERLDHCQCRHVCRGSRSDARLQHQQPLVVRKRGGD